MGFEKLIDLIVQFLEFFRFCSVVDCDERGVRLRLGKYVESLEPGWYAQRPFFIEKIRIKKVKAQTHELTSQSLVTADGKNVAVGVVILYSIHNIEKALLEVRDVDEAITDACLGNMASAIRSSTWETICSPEFDDILTAPCRKRGWRYGIEIESVRINELAPQRTLRLITGG